MAIRRLILLGGAVVSLACGGDDGGNGGTGPPDGDPGENQVRVQNNVFNPATRSAEPGATISWVWASGGVEHNVTFDDGEESGNQSSGTFTRTFTEAGDYPYHCTIHGSPTGGMRGTVQVAATGGGAGNGGGGGGGGDDDGGYPGGY
jgi:plastocyanin